MNVWLCRHNSVCDRAVAFSKNQVSLDLKWHAICSNKFKCTSTNCLETHSTSSRHLFLPHQWADWACCVYFVDISLIVFVSSTLLSNSLNLNSVMCTGFCQIWVTLCWLHVTVQKALSTNCHIHRSKSSFKGKAELVTHRCRDGVLTKGESIQVHYLNKSIHTPL